MKKNVLMMLVVLGLTLTSCSKEGCIDPLADNYDASADVSDNSCVYTADMVFWWSESTSALFYNQLGFSPSFQINVDGEYVGTVSMAEFWSTIPDCSNSNALTHSIGIGNNTTKSVTISAYYDGQELISAPVMLEGGACTPIEL